MARHSRLACLFALLVVASAERDQSRWSRQISSYTSDISDWVPLPGPVEREPLPLPPPQFKRQIAEPRILSEPAFPGFGRPTGFNQEAFPSRTYYNAPANRQLYLQSVPAVPSAPQNYLSEQGFGQGIRFGLSQPNFPLNQGFIGPQFSFPQVPQEPAPLIKPRPQVSNPIRFESFPNSNLPSPQAKPFNHAPKRLDAPKFVDGYRVENASSSSVSFKKKPQSLQKLKFESFDKVPKTEMIPPNRPKSEREEVQLLYVPLESLNRGQFNFRSQLPSSSQLHNVDPYAQNIQRPSVPKQTFAADFQRPVAKPVDTFGTEDDFFTNFQSQYNIDQVPKFSTVSSPFPTSLPTTPKPKKLKPHQPPLAIFLTQEAKKGNQVKVGDVLLSLKNAESIAVLDSVNPLTAPKVFIGPSNLNPPEKFIKFELPYLSNIDHSDKKIRQLPFFVAPLSYNTPNGFAKIPFPSPHVGSVVINSQIRDTTTPTASTLSTPAADVIPNSYSTSPQSYRLQPKPVTQKPSFSYYSTNPPKTNSPLNYQSNYYSIEPQTVSTIRTPKEPQAITETPTKTGSYFLSNFNQQYNPQVIYEPQNNFKTPEPVRAFNIAKQTEGTPSPKTTVPSTTTKSSTYPSQLLETHNPYSINQAFQFSTPLDYHNLFDESYATPSLGQPLPSSPGLSSLSTTPSTKPADIVTEKQKYPSSPNYLQNYSPEIHYSSEIQNPGYPVYNTDDYTTKSEVTSQYGQSVSPDHNVNTQSVSSVNPPTEYNVSYENQSPVDDNTEIVNRVPSSDTLSTRSPYLYNQYETSHETDDIQTAASPTTSTTTTTTTTRRTPLRSRGRPRYPTTKTDSNESTTKGVVTRKPLRERRPLPARPKYEPNRITTERITRKPIDSNESTTKYPRTRTRGRVHYKPTESDELHNKPNKYSSKEADLAYQRDVLHQNYPVTLMERTSTLDIEAITDPSPKISSTKNLEDTVDVYDTENAYSNDRASISQQYPNEASKEDIPTYTSSIEVQTETSYIPKLSSARNEEYTFQSRSSLAPVDAISSYDETAPEEDLKQTTPVQKTEKPEVVSYATESSKVNTEQNLPNYSITNEFSSSKQPELTTPDIEITKLESQEASQEDEIQEEVVQTTPSYNRVRVRPGVIRQYHQASTESSRTKTDRRRPVQAVTYRPAFDRRRTTMRIEEIEADLKTKQVHTRPEVQDYRHPVYRPEPTTEQTVTSPSTQDTTTKRGVFRRRRPTYTTTSTEASSTKRAAYELKNRFRGRRPTTEKPTEKPEIQSDVSSTTVRNTIYSRYSNRPRLSERYNKKPESEDSEDQESNYSVNRPKYIEPESDQWSPKVSTDSFKPYNPNDIIDEKKVATTERKSSYHDEDELDIITAKNEYDDILISVTPATNTRANKKIPDIPPTLEALVEQSKVTKSDSADAMSTFETMLEEVMKSLEEQDENEYTSNVMKHKGGEIGEIPPERIITSGDSYSQKTTTVVQQEETTIEPMVDDSTHNEDEADRKGRRRGFWKKVKVRPITESIEAAESQFYPNAVNRLGHTITLTKTVHDKSGKYDKPKPKVTTYKPNFHSIKDVIDYDKDNESFDVLPTVDIAKLNTKDRRENNATTSAIEEHPIETTEPNLNKETPTEPNSYPGNMDLGTGSPDSTLIDNMSYSTPTEPSSSSDLGLLDRADGFSLMDYLFGTSSNDDDSHASSKKTTTEEISAEELNSTKELLDLEITTEQVKPKLPTTESSYVPEEITTERMDVAKTESTVVEFDIKKVNSTEKPKLLEKVIETTEKTLKVETSSMSSYIDPTNVVSTSMSTEISHETEICFRGKCIKSKDIL